MVIYKEAMVRTIETINGFGMKETLKMKNKSLKYQLIKVKYLKIAWRSKETGDKYREIIVSHTDHYKRIVAGMFAGNNRSSGSS